jgi:hypothetical protein
MAAWEWVVVILVGIPVVGFTVFMVVMVAYYLAMFLRAMAYLLVGKIPPE